ncbi:LSU ribosomal protein L10P [Dongia mobilis]|uniref:Large ribosomal subunit protein uL10 n=1 Tax=Dongia mobilis TaxID=578943 RepID=A0A4R6WNL0_9PROT|nr:50S ribosomal protein L10 [Dongia mobilis]TDQ77739.1 LSU ribosomal protein L10P [Dongia mobilis]
MDRSGKEKLVSELQESLNAANLVVVTHQNGLSVAEVSDLRRKMRAAGAGFKVAKNRLAKLALTGTKHEGLGEFLKGPTALAYSADPVAAAKVAVTFAKSNEKLSIVGGSMGTETLGADGIKALATLPSLDELRAKLVGMLQTPATRVAVVTAAPAGQLARVLGAYARKGEA